MIVTVAYIANPATDTENHEEIEVTPEMIEAGREAMSAHWLDFVGPEGFRLLV